MTTWMEIAQADLGETEMAGARANQTILGYFRQVGRADVTSDEVAWCAAFTGAALSKAGVRTGIKQGQELLASSFLRVGTPIDTPRYGAIACVPRKGGSGWHVAFVAGWTDTRLKLLGGNQANSVNETWFPREGAVLRWPAEPVAAVEGSRITAAAGGSQKDVAKVAAVSGVEVAAEAGGLKDLAARAADLQSSWTTLEQFGVFVAGKGKWIAGALALYWLARMAWRAGWIKRWRAEDSNEGKTT